MHNHPMGKPKIPIPKERLKDMPTSKLRIRSDVYTLDFYIMYTLEMRYIHEPPYLCDSSLNDFISYMRKIGYTEASINHIITKATNRIKLGVETYSRLCRLRS